MSTKYLVTRTEQDSSETLVATKSKKSEAIALADADRVENRRTVTVTTDKGTVVHTVAGVRPMKSTPRFSKVVDLPEGFEVPEGARPAYNRLKHDAIIVSFDELKGEDNRYGIVRVSTGKLLKNRFRTTRDAGQFVLTIESPKAKEARLAAEKAAAEELANA